LFARLTAAHSKKIDNRAQSRDRLVRTAKGFPVPPDGPHFVGGNM
jgi:hypothetical protein